MELSKRLQGVADLVSPGVYVADIGTDHGYIPIYLVKSRRNPGAIAMDINYGPLERAKEHIQTHQLTSLIQTRLSDGFSALKDEEVSSVIMAGMGGGLIVKLLSNQNIPQGIKEFILQPQSETEKIRAYLVYNGFHIMKEDMVCDDGKFYNMMKVVKGKNSKEEEEHCLYGYYLLKHKHSVLEEFLHREIKIKEDVLINLKDRSGQHIEQRVRELKEEVTYAKEILYRYYEDHRNNISS